ncbi:MAG: RNA-binding transcriptional accessory protein, partial [Myxococcales bacterium]|nr:RNA-binding transcriptional accessory protein [Myxococcales bacterium]
SASTKAQLEDLYLPYKQKRRTRAAMARDKGLGPLAQMMLTQAQHGHPQREAQAFVRRDAQDPDRAVNNIDDALQGARDIVAELMAERADVRSLSRQAYGQGVLTSKAIAKKVAEAEKRGPTRFEAWYDFQEPLRRLASHRFLAVQRGAAEGLLRVHVTVDRDRLLARIEQMMGVNPRSPWRGELQTAIEDGVRRLLGPSVEKAVLADVKAWADDEAVEVFARNLRNLLLASPLGGKAVVGIDPGLRTGCKCAAVDGTGRFGGTITLFLSRSEQERQRAEAGFSAFIAKHRPAAIAVGNGTGGREAEAFVRKLLKGQGDRTTAVVSVSESGASVYSASDIARQEFPDLDLTIRGAISIARRLQDPLAELVKVEPKAIGVGQYQHDVQQRLLLKKLDEVVESCVNHVGVELNTASAPLLAHVAGIGPARAKKIVAHRDDNGPFGSRKGLLQVPGLGKRSFEQAAGFLRVRGGTEPLDASAVHPERYGLVRQMARDVGVNVAALVGNADAVERIDLRRYVTQGDGDGAADQVGELTLQDIASELSRPGRDPRQGFEAPRFRDDVQTVSDLRPDMTLEGVVTNVAQFGAFVDIGVHQDGLVHISELADRFVRDPHSVVKVGDRLTVRVLSVDERRKRIALSAKGLNS